jgi:aminoglycoside phosphotransferase (APT) family kinase protein
MRPPWQADISVSVDLARSLIESQFPSLAPAEVKPFGAGWDNTAFLVNDAKVFRFPRRTFAVQFMDAEIAVMPWVGPQLPIPVPVPRWIGQPTEMYPWPFAGYIRIPGRTACSFGLDVGQRTSLARPLARFLRALHGIDVTDAARHGAGSDRIARLDLGPRLPEARDDLERLARLGVISDVRPYQAIFERWPDGYIPKQETLVHGDLYARHLLLDAGRSLAGVIDWGDVHLGDPAADLMIVHAFLPLSARKAFREEYPPITDLSWEVAQVRALWHTLKVARYAHEINDIDLAREAQASFHHLAMF